MNQVALAFWSNFYDNIFDHPERPSKDVVDNDELLDQWVEEQAKKMEERTNKNAQGGKTSSAYDHEEVITFEQFDEGINEES
ncbi:hypothetical protein [Chengkuizengella axinellae]|uniref:Uncharacterized protein n=1 Tax=Chengkuizengella axinellae TaxID=3064388 RepID=A0ABT9IXY6_9BACL|nr:hypothetical protein [Chengkuizengella sp. 2205SS18-9]MDP5273660.1 hypothetical protein [Chengkuizengella sp. 2205SS18-9]